MNNPSLNIWDNHELNHDWIILDHDEHGFHGDFFIRKKHNKKNDDFNRRFRLGFRGIIPWIC